MSLPTTCPHCGVRLDPGLEPDRPRSDLEPPRVEDVSETPTSPQTATPEPVPTAEDLASAGTIADPISLASLSSSDDRVPARPDIAASPTLLGINLGSPPAPAARPSPLDRDVEVAAGPVDSGDEADASTDLDGTSAGRSAWPLALLASYASAITLACGWLWWTGHRGRPESPAPTWAAELVGPEAGDAPEADDDGRRDDDSASVEPPEPVAAGRRVPLGESLRVDALEITPLGVSVGPVELERVRLDGKFERRKGGDDALRLRLRLRNTSDDVIFAPLDEAFIREPDRRLPETFIEDASGTRVYAYRLPIASEWGIAGQDFRTLRPGESSEMLIVSDADATDRLDGPLTWRLRLRTATEKTAVVGVAFKGGELDNQGREGRGEDRDDEGKGR